MMFFRYLWDLIPFQLKWKSTPLKPQSIKSAIVKIRKYHHRRKKEECRYCERIFLTRVAEYKKGTLENSNRGRFCSLSCSSKYNHATNRMYAVLLKPAPMQIEQNIV